MAGTPAGGDYKMLKRRFGLAVAVGLTLASAGCVAPGYNLPPAHHLAAPGPGVDGPGPGVLSSTELSGDPAGGAASAGRASVDAGFTGTSNAQIMFARPAGMEVFWDVTGSGQFSSTPLIAPGRANFRQAGLYRLKITNIEGHEGVELYPSLEVGPANPRTMAFLAHNTIPVQLTVDDINQVMSGNFVTKVIYLPDPEFQELAVAGVETLVSTRLDPGVDPVDEADRRGVILAILRAGNKDMEMAAGAQEPPVSAISSVGYNASAGYAGGGYATNANAANGLINYGPAAGTGGYIAGQTGPAYGMPITGTPIGLPGPPHIPLGGPAGLQKHVIRNHTHQYIPDPTRKIKMHVKQLPGIRYPQPANRAWIKQYNYPNCAHCVANGTNGCNQCGGRY